MTRNDWEKLDFRAFHSNIYSRVQLINFKLITFANDFYFRSPIDVDPTTEIELNYSVWVGSDISEKYSIRVTVPENSTFFEVMTIAAEIDERFVFEYETFSFGRFITSIGGHSQNPDENLFWFVYEYPENYPNVPGKEFLSAAVDVLIVKKKYQYLFWLQNSTH